jgi:predicted dehydrogenase
MLRIGFIGAGNIAREYLSRIDGHADVQLAAVCDLDVARASALAGSRAATIYADYRVMLDRERLDAVFDNLPPFGRGDELIEAARRGVAIFTTKPLGLELATAEASLAAIERAGVVNGVGYMFRYAGIVERARELLAGRPVALYLAACLGATPAGWFARKAASGGQIVEQSTHLFDAGRYLCGDVRSVFAIGRSDLIPGQVDYENVSTVTLDFERDCVGTVVSTSIVPQYLWRATIVARDLHLDLTFDIGQLKGVADGKQVDLVDPRSGYVEQVAAFLEAVRRNDQSLIRCSYRDGVGTFATTLAANRSLESGRPEEVGATAIAA